MALTLALTTYPKLVTSFHLWLWPRLVVLFAEEIFMTMLCRTRVKRADVQIGTLLRSDNLTQAARDAVEVCIP